MKNQQEIIAYKERVYAQSHPYAHWYSAQRKASDTAKAREAVEAGNASKARELVEACNASKARELVEAGNASKAREAVDTCNAAQGFCVCFAQEGLLEEEAICLFSEYFAAHPDALCVYGDEDILYAYTKAGERWTNPYAPEPGYDGIAKEVCNQIEASEGGVAKGLCYQVEASKGGVSKEVCNSGRTQLQLELGRPWLKPDWSPDTFQSFFYFGNVFAIRRCQETEEVFQRLSLKDGLLPFDEAMRWQLWEALKQLLPGAEKAKIGHLDKILFHYRGDYAWEERILYPTGEAPETVSLIIPSKDHPELLCACLNSLQPLRPGIEIIVVDNGSCEAKKEEIQKLQKQIPFTYLYEPMDFNFSRMCNLGAKKATGEVLVFLNDDITAKGSDWLTPMAAQALKPHTGAVGAKLLYPGEERLQHVGITNMSAGPVHKLGGCPIETGNLHNRARGCINVLAVTAAALAIQKSKFDAVGGFWEDLAVAYNDVELGFRLWKQGYYNVVRTDAVLVHHESLSRGQDTSEEKKRRLQREARRLYERHPDLKGKDPFYHKHLVQWRLDAEYHIEAAYPYDCPDEHTPLEAIKPVKETRGIFRRLLRKGPEVLLCIDAISTEGQVVTIEGWSNFLERSPLGYQRYLLLQNIAKPELVYRVPVLDKYRPDTQAALPKQAFYELSGLVVRTKLALGEYRIGILYASENRQNNVHYMKEQETNCRFTVNS